MIYMKSQQSLTLVSVLTLTVSINSTYSRILAPLERTVSTALRKIRHQISGSNVSGEHATRVNLADGLFIQRDLDLTPGFLKRFQAIFQRHVAQINFTDPLQAKDILNQWVENQTDGEKAVEN